VHRVKDPGKGGGAAGDEQQRPPPPRLRLENASGISNGAPRIGTHGPLPPQASHALFVSPHLHTTRQHTSQHSSAFVSIRQYTRASGAHGAVRALPSYGLFVPLPPIVLGGAVLEALAEGARSSGGRTGSSPIITRPSCRLNSARIQP